MSEVKKESDLRAVVVVVVIAAICAAGLAFVKQSTEEKIAEAIRQETLAALQKVVPEGCTIDLEKQKSWPEGAADALDVYPGFADGELCGIAVKTKSDTGYSGRIVLAAGFAQLESPETLVLQRIYVTQHAETPGLGSNVTRMQDEPVDTWGTDPVKVFGLNFNEKPVANLTFEVKKSAAGEFDVAAVTAATISSKAVTAAVKDAADLVKGNLAELKAAFAGN